MKLARIRRAVGDAPAVRAWQLAFSGNERGARLCFGVLLVYAGIALGTLTTTRVERAMILGSHFRPASIGAWVALQPAPKMYGFANRAWTSPRPLVLSPPALEAFERSSAWVNHYPARYARFDGVRRATPLPKWVTIRSSYRETTVWTRIEVSMKDGEWFLSPRELPR